MANALNSRRLNFSSSLSDTATSVTGDVTKKSASRGFFGVDNLPSSTPSADPSSVDNSSAATETSQPSPAISVNVVSPASKVRDQQMASSATTSPSENGADKTRAPDHVQTDADAKSATASRSAVSTKPSTTGASKVSKESQVSKPKKGHFRLTRATEEEGPVEGIENLSKNTKRVVIDAAERARLVVEMRNETMPLGAVLHILRERRKDHLYLNCFIFIIFLVIYSIVIYMQHYPYFSFTQNEGIRDAILFEPFAEPDDLRSFDNIGEIAEWWLWFRGPLQDKIWGTTYYNGDPRDNGDEARILSQTYVIGAVQLRQVATQNKTQQLKSRQFNSWPAFSAATEERTANHWRYGEYRTGLGNLDGKDFDVGLQVNYGTGGYVHYLPYHNATEASATIDRLYANRWIDQGTRIVAVDVNFYNPTTKVISALRVITEFEAAGIVHRQGWVFSARLGLYDMTETVNIVRVSLESIFCVFVLYYIFDELREFYFLRLVYCNLINVIEICNFVLMLGVVAVHVYFINELGKTKLDSEAYEELYSLTELWAVKKNMASATLFISFCRLFKYLELNNRVKVLWYSLRNSAFDLVSAAACLFILCTAFAISGMMLFGENIQDFTSFGYAMSFLLRAIIGDFDYVQLRYFHPNLAPFFFLAYIVMVFIVMFNLGIAIIIDGYEDAKEIILHQKFEDQRVPFVQDFLHSVVQRLRLKMKEFALRFSQGKNKNRAKVAAAGDELPGGVGVNADKRQAVLRLANKDESASQQHMSSLVESIRTSQYNITPASQLKDKFKGHVEVQFHRMYASDALATHALGGDSRINLSTDDLTEILGDEYVAAEVMSLYKQLKTAREQAQKRKLGAASKQAQKSAQLPLNVQMAQAINALSRQLQFVASKVVSDDIGSIPDPVEIHVSEQPETGEEFMSAVGGLLEPRFAGGHTGLRMRLGRSPTPMRPLLMSAPEAL